MTVDFQNLPRWIMASMNKWFVEESDDIITFTEGTDRGDGDEAPKDFAEFRLDGPRIKEWSYGYYEIWCAVNILFQSVMDDADFHRKFVTVGKILGAFTKRIPIYRYGDGPDDDGSHVGCMHLIQDKNNQIQVNHFGQVEPEVRLEQGTIEGHYRMYLSDN